MTHPEALSFELEHAALRALFQSWSEANYHLFAERLRPPTLRCADLNGAYARWIRGQRVIEFARSALLSLTWGQIEEVLKHEMAHQYVDEVLGATEETAHGPAFQRACAMRGIDARASGLPDAAASPTSQRVLERIAKLLALAESPNEHEAQNAMNAARRLMLQHNLDASQRAAAQGYVFRHLGRPQGRLDDATSWIGTILQRHFFVQIISLRVWQVREGKPASVLEASGTVENVDMAEYVYSFLQHTADALWALHKKRLGIRGDRDRRQFRSGVMRGFLEKLDADQVTHKEQGLVWVGDPGLEAFHRRRYPRIRSVSRGATQGEAFHHGRAQGREVVLHKGVRGGDLDRGLRLGPGRS